MSGHTDTPWHLGWQNVVASNGADFCEIPLATGWVEDAWIGDDATDESKANARRIVAAVNGTATLSTEALEAGVVDKLVEAASVAVEELDCIAEFAMRQTEWTGDDDAALLAVKNLRAALALARGEQA